jgi:Flp pilus assembly protein TadB
LLVQTATGILVLVGLRTESHEVWLLLILLALTLGLLSAFWFSSITHHAKKEATAQIQEGFSREREKIRVRAEREKSRMMEKNHQRFIKERDRFQTRSNIKSGALFAGVLTLGGILAFTQFFTFGMLLMTTAVGALSGYLLHSRQLLPGRRQKPFLESRPTEKTIGEKVRGKF